MKSDGDDDEEDDQHNPYQEHSSDREFIEDTGSSGDSDSTDRDSSTSNKPSKEFAARVYMEESPTENEDHDILLDENEKSFFNALRTNNTELVDVILQQHRFVNILDEDKNTPLHVATLLKHVDTVKVLIEHHAKPNELNANEQIPALAFAAINKDPECFKVLLDITDLQLCDKVLVEHMEGRSLVHLIVEDTSNGKIVDAGNIKLCLNLLQKHNEKYLKKCLSKLDDLQGTPLVAAIRSHCFQVSF